MKKKILALMLALVCLFTPVLAEEKKPEFTTYQQQEIIRYYGHLIADNYFYGVSDNNLLYAVVCATIENDGQFDLDVAVKAMIDFLGDEYSEYYSAEVYDAQTQYYSASFFGIGAVLAPQKGGTAVDSVYVGGGAEKAGMKSGDVILAVDGVDASAMAPAQVRELLIGEDGTTVRITVQRGEEIIDIYAVRGKVEESHSSMEMLSPKTAYIDIKSFTASLPGEFDKYIEELRSNGTQNVIIDLRGNGGGDLDAAISVAQKLIPAGHIAKIKSGKKGEHEETIYSENLNAPSWKMLVLVDDKTASASEFLAMALQSRGRAKLLGVNTFGKGCMQAMIKTPMGSGFKFTVGEYFSVTDQRIHTVGLTPDIYVENLHIPIDAEGFDKIDFEDLDSTQTKLAIEQRLAALSLIPDETVDGEFDEFTENALKVFQRLGKLEETGKLDFDTAFWIASYDFEGIEKIVDIQMEEALKYFE